MKQYLYLLLAVAVIAALFCTSCAPGADVGAAPAATETPAPTPTPNWTYCGPLPISSPGVGPPRVFESRSTSPDCDEGIEVRVGDEWIPVEQLELREELEENIGVCLVSSYQFDATLPTGDRVSSITVFWIAEGSDGVRVHTYFIDETTWKVWEGYRTFQLTSTEELTQFERVVVEITIDGRTFKLRRPVRWCFSGISA